jgi:TRAP-type C4-dicarboxylate transport system permease small subunit
MKTLLRLEKAIARAEGFVLIALLGALMILAFTDVFMGRFFDTGIEWINRFFGYSMITLGLLGGSLATREERHINIDLFGRFLPPRPKAAMYIVLNLIAAWVCYLFTRESWHYIFNVERAGSDALVTYGGGTLVGVWVLYLILPAAFGMMTVRFFGLGVRSVLIAGGLRPPPEPPPAFDFKVEAPPPAAEPKEARP